MSTDNRHRGVMLYYATRDGQSRRIAERISRRLAESGVVTMPQDLAVTPVSTAELAQASVVMLVAAVRYGRHLPEADRLMASYGSLHSPPPFALASVNLTARKPDKTTETGNGYLRKAIAHNRLAPALAVAFAGRLDYRRYSWLDRQIIRFIMLLTGGPTSLDACVEYTAWSAVDEFAARIGDIVRAEGIIRIGPAET